MINYSYQVIIKLLFWWDNRLKKESPDYHVDSWGIFVFGASCSKVARNLL